VGEVFDDSEVFKLKSRFGTLNPGNRVNQIPDSIKKQKFGNVPRIINCTPSSGIAKDTVFTLTGTGFGPRQHARCLVWGFDNRVVRQGGRGHSWEDNRIVGQVPDIEYYKLWRIGIGSYPDLKLISNTVPFTVIKKNHLFSVSQISEKSSTYLSINGEVFNPGTKQELYMERNQYGEKKMSFVLRLKRHGRPLSEFWIPDEAAWGEYMVYWRQKGNHNRTSDIIHLILKPYIEEITPDKGPFPLDSRILIKGRHFGDKGGSVVIRGPGVEWGFLSKTFWSNRIVQTRLTINLQSPPRTTPPSYKKYKIFIVYEAGRKYDSINWDYSHILVTAR
jgi:hypothetical protein